MTVKPEECEDCRIIEGYHRSSWNKVLCRTCHMKRWKNKLKPLKLDSYWMMTGEPRKGAYWCLQTEVVNAVEGLKNDIEAKLVEWRSGGYSRESKLAVEIIKGDLELISKHFGGKEE